MKTPDKDPGLLSGDRLQIHRKRSPQPAPVPEHDRAQLLSGVRRPIKRRQRPPHSVATQLVLTAGETWLDFDGRQFDGPATISIAGDRVHRDGGPAIEGANGHREWWVDGELHRDAGPAFEYSDRLQAWYRHGKRHRDDGPAVVRADGLEEWYQDDKLHRDDGPALTSPTGTERWFKNGIEIFPPGTKKLEPVEDTPERRAARRDFLKRSKTFDGIDLEVLREAKKSGWGKEFPLPCSETPE